MRLLSMILITAIASASLPAYAADDDAPTQAELAAATKKFREAQQKYEQKDYAAALDLARMAHEVSSSPNARLYIARSLRELGRLAEAYEEMSIVLREATERAQSESKYEPTRDAAAAELALLARKVGRVIIALADPPPGTKVELNGAPIDEKRLGEAIAVMPGEVVVKAAASGADPIERKLEIGAGDTKTIALAFGDAKAEPDVEQSAEPETSPAHEGAGEQTGGGSLRTVGFVAAGIGVAGLAVFGIAGSMAKSEFDSLEEECNGERCTDPKYADTVDRGKNLQTIANIGLVVGAVGLVAGGTMILLGGPKKRESAGLIIQPGGFAVGYRQRF
jgi:hypothetical protein